MAATEKGRWRRVAIYVAVATGLGLFASTQHFLGMRMAGSSPTWRHAVSAELPGWYLWLAAFPLVMWFVRRVRLLRPHLFRNVVQHVLFAFAVIVVHSALRLFVQRHTGFANPDRPYWAAYAATIPWGFTTGILSYGAILGLALARDYYLRFRERTAAATDLAAQLAEAQLAALRMQLNPHFLFNTLNSVAMLVRGGQPREAVAMLAGLSDLLRTVLETSPPQEVTLREELRFISRYLDIERMRFSDRLRVEVHAPEETLEALVPNLVLQPLVENALRHGIARRVSAGLLEVRAERLNGTLQLSVADDGPGPPPEPREGVGLRNTRNRLARLYGSAQALSLAPTNGAGNASGAVAVVRLPFHSTPIGPP